VEQFNMANASAIDGLAQNRLSAQAPLLPVASPNAPHKLCLETSFTSLQSPNDEQQVAMANGGRASGLSKNSSTTGNFFSGRSQLSSMGQYDISSLVDDSGIPKSISGPSEATTVIFAEQQLQVNKLESTTDISSSISNLPRNAPSTLPLDQPADAKFKKVDLIYDEWFGLAPLASPESLSELSSISSRASNGITLTSSIDKFLHLQSQSKPGQINEEEPLLEPMHTPVIMRRTPKIVGNLSTCADDWKSVNSYKRMGKYFVSHPQRVPSNDDSNDSTVDIYESATSLRLQEGSRSADNLEDGPNMYTGGATNKLAVSDSAILNECQSGCPTCPCTGFTVGACCPKLDHSKCLSDTYRFQQHQQQQQHHQPRYSFTNTTSSSETNYQSALSSLTGLDYATPFGHSSPSASSLTHQNGSVSSRPGVLESHFPVYPDTCDEHLSLLSNERTSPAKVVRFTKNGSASSTSGSSSVATKANQQSSRLKKRNQAVDSGGSPNNAFSRNESLPLLSNLAERSSPQHFVRRKNYVYPASNSPSPSPLHRSKNNGQPHGSPGGKGNKDSNKLSKRGESNV
jgi:hypothetical protein